jgi:hypothetical protein
VSRKLGWLKHNRVWSMEVSEELYVRCKTFVSRRHWTLRKLFTEALVEYLKGHE